MSTTLQLNRSARSTNQGKDGRCLSFIQLWRLLFDTPSAVASRAGFPSKCISAAACRNLRQRLSVLDQPPLSHFESLKRSRTIPATRTSCAFALRLGSVSERPRLHFSHSPGTRVVGATRVGTLAQWHDLSSFNSWTGHAATQSMCQSNWL